MTARYYFGSTPARTSSTFIGCRDCGLLVWDRDQHGRVAHAGDPEPEQPTTRPAKHPRSSLPDLT